MGKNLLYISEGCCAAFLNGLNDKHKRISYERDERERSKLNVKMNRDGIFVGTWSILTGHTALTQW